ncbi:MAG: ribose 5-phosphate isomerase A [Chloroflexaceae bacterium]|nr:ribose 5-phosphate isomerase A [Chloroflexaceae bacterium]
MNLKQQAAEAAVARVTSGMRLGLGSGSTVQYVLEALAQRLQQGDLHDIVGVPTSETTHREATRLGIALTTLDEQTELNLTIDGADEVSPDLNLIKGLGGALLREKIVAAASNDLFIVVDASKQVEQLGLRAPLPVEVMTFGWKTHLGLLEHLGATPALRLGANNQPYVTDNGNLILDCTFANGIQDPYELAQQLDAQPGVVGHGLFLGMTSAVFVGTPEEVVVLE